jgi:two-component system cell cycle sensor histidine kinase/response regulator CckA
MPRGGRLTIGTFSSHAQDVVTISSGLAAVPPGRYVALALTDSGEGMDERTRERIFEPFFTTKELGKGTGLGLATVYGIVKQLGGYIWVSSEIGIGTTFTLFFPESEAAPLPVNPQAMPSRDVAVATTREMVLVVEDEVGLRKLVARTLTRHGYQVIEAGTGQQGLELAAKFENQVQLVVSDVVMPLMSGPEMVRQLRNTRPEIKVLYMSGYAGEVVMRGGALEANTSFLEKPFAARDLLQTVSEILSAQ